jgi:hypothetical protein
MTSGCPNVLVRNGTALIGRNKLHRQIVRVAPSDGAKLLFDPAEKNLHGPGSTRLHPIGPLDQFGTESPVRADELVDRSSLLGHHPDKRLQPCLRAAMRTLQRRESRFS